MRELVRVSGLDVVAGEGPGAVTIAKDIAFNIQKGQVLALIGESGSGKTTIALALAGYARPGCRIACGSIQIGDTDVLSLNARQLRAFRGSKVSYIAQSAAAGFNPFKSIMSQVIEPALVHGLMSRSAAERKAVELFASLALPAPETIGRRYPHQLSGGQLQRLMAAMALITDPELVILDEPTTALDVTTQIEVLRAFKAAIRERGKTAVYVSHDLAVVAQMADHIVVLNHGQMRECGTTDAIIDRPSDSYTRSLIAAVAPPVRTLEKSRLAEPAPLLEIKGLCAGYGPRDASGMPRNPVLQDFDLSIRRGATMGIIGESGSGKSTLARVIAGLMEPARGTIAFDGKALPPGLSKRTREDFRRVQIVFQNPDTALNPAHTVARIIGRPLSFYRGLKGQARDVRIAELLEMVRLPADLATRRCGALSGGQKQRINLARALAAEPDLILCDEVTSALDTVVGAAILDLMYELRRSLNVSYMFISHDISTVRSICDEIAVLYAGRKVEEASQAAFLEEPHHPYTSLLISSVPEMRRGWLENRKARQASAPTRALPIGSQLCSFWPRCPVRVEGLCDRVPPPRQRFAGGRDVLCHAAEPDRAPSAAPISGKEAVT
ncbi:MAG: ABC transporter ATP-binding protein [Pseudomonadota bacterium]|nr:ABC transporter ATP-binding protein [Pseudomonadota bacterium]